MELELIDFVPHQNLSIRMALLEWFMRQDEATDADMAEWVRLKRISGESPEPQLLYY